MRRVPVVVTGTEPVTEQLRRLVRNIAGDLAGREGFSLDLADTLGPEPSILVETSESGPVSAAPLLEAVRSGHAAVTAHLASLVGDPVDFGVLIADRRLGVSAALLPGIPIVVMLTQARDSEQQIEMIRVEGPDPMRLREEAVIIARLVGLELRLDHVRVDGDLGDLNLRWSAVIGSNRFPRLVARAAGNDPEDSEPAWRTVTVCSSAGHELTMCGHTGGTGAVAVALLDDVLALARERDTAWRHHRRLQTGLA